LTTGAEQLERLTGGGGADDSFQRLLLDFSNVAAKSQSASEILHFFCASTCRYFGVSGTYVWNLISPDQLVGAAASGWMADRFAAARLKTHESAIASEAIRKKHTLYINGLNTASYPMAAEFQARSLMAAPLIVFNEVIGAAVFLHNSDAHYFNPDHAAKATILAAQLGSFLEAARLSDQSREEQRRAEILAEVAQSLHSEPDLGPLMETVAGRLRALLRTPLVCILIREDSGFEMAAVSTETPEAAVSVRARHDRKSFHFISDLAVRALSAGEPISVTIDAAAHSLADLVPPGTLIAAPFRTSNRDGVALVYPRAEGPLNAEERALLPVITGFAAVAIANAELYAKARGQAHELHQIVGIASELGSISDLDQFMRKFIQRACEFLGFGRAFIGLLQNGKMQVRWTFTEGRDVPAGYPLPEGILTRTLERKEVLWSDDAANVPGVNLDVVNEFQVRQILVVPLLGTARELLGAFGVLDRLDASPIVSEDIRRAQALAAQVTVALEVSRNLLLSEQHRQKSEALTSLALQVNSLLRGPQFAQEFLDRAASIVEARRAALIVGDTGGSASSLIQTPAAPFDLSLHARLSHALASALRLQNGPFISGGAEDVLGADLAEQLGWKEVVVASLQGSSGELLGSLCFADRGKPLDDSARQLIQAIAGQVSVSLENSRFLTRMEQANRHWIEIFDAISDFIVAHDHTGNILRVNRALAEFIGVQPQHLIGLNMGALLATGNAPPSRSCPFCRGFGGGTDEFVHPVLERTYLVSTSQVHAASSEGLQTIHVLKDITDRREAERRYRELFDNIQEGLFFCSPDGRFVEVNEALVRMLGFPSREDLLHCDPRDEVFRYADQHRELVAEMERSGVLRNREVTLKRRDGNAVHVLVNSFAVRDVHGQIAQFRGLMLDITGLKAYQAELQRERDFSSKILNNTQSLILVADTAGLISYANRRWQVMGYEQESILGQPLEALIAGPRREAFQEALGAVLAGNQVDNLELQILRADGRVGQFSVNLSPMRDDAGHVTSIIVVMSDVTDAASLQAKLMHAEKMAAVGQLVSGVAHEVNNPLTAILGFADLLMENSELPESARKDLRVILQEAQRTKQIVQNLLSFARQMPPQRKPVQLNAILKRTVQLRSYDLQSRGVGVTEHFEEELPFVVGDAHQLQQVFLNILNNAYDAVKESTSTPRIEISTCSNDAFVEISFRDNGHGISQSERIFDPFFTTKHVGEGTGLGLSICYGIVKEHGGEILCFNNEQGAGATFTVRLPAMNELASLTAAAGVIKP
jgi:PAS domain S-box-containing protein